MFTKEELIEIRNLIDGSKDKLTDETSRIRNSIGSKIFSKLHGCSQEEPASEDFEKEMDNYIPTVFSKDMDSGEPRFTTWFRALRKTARHFANWQKNKMMEDAVDGVVAASAGALIATGFVKSEDVNVKFGDKIKIIVVKED